MYYRISGAPILQPTNYHYPSQKKRLLAEPNYQYPKDADSLRTDDLPKSTFPLENYSYSDMTMYLLSLSCEPAKIMENKKVQVPERRDVATGTEFNTPRPEISVRSEHLLTPRPYVPVLGVATRGRATQTTRIPCASKGVETETTTIQYLPWKIVSIDLPPISYRKRLRITEERRYCPDGLNLKIITDENVKLFMPGEGWLLPPKLDFVASSRRMGNPYVKNNTHPTVPASLNPETTDLDPVMNPSELAIPTLLSPLPSTPSQSPTDVTPPASPVLD